MQDTSITSLTEKSRIPEMKTQVAVLACLVVVVASLTIDDQPLNGRSLPSKFATNITPTLSYTPKM